MDKDIKDYLKYYIGFVNYRNSYVDHSDGSMTVWCLLTPGRYARLVEDLSVTNIQILLRKIESMTDEEASDVYTIEQDRILHPPTNDVDVRRINNAWQIVRLDQLDTKLFVVDDGVVYKVTEDGGKPMIEYTRNMPLIFHYLLSRGFDLFGLIESGLALEKETIKS